MITGIFLILGVVAFRVGVGLTGSPEAMALGNFSPLAATFLCGAAFLAPRMAVLVPFGAFLISDVILNLHTGRPVVGAMTLVLLGTFLVVWVLGDAWRQRRGPRWALFGGCVVGTVFFYLITNTFAFAVNPAYTKTLAGWIQALTIGQPNFPPTLWFLAKSLVGNLAFTAIFIAAFSYSRAGEPSAVAAA